MGRPQDISDKLSRGILHRRIYKGAFYAMDQLRVSDGPSVNKPTRASIRE
jgi:hypothetical protein